MENSLLYTSILSTKASKEIKASWLWYEERQFGLGDRFVQAVINCIKKIEQHPERYPSRFKTYRETMVDVFPFLIVYKINKKQKKIFILSVFHARRNPDKKYKK